MFFFYETILALLFFFSSYIIIFLSEIFDFIELCVRTLGLYCLIYGLKKSPPEVVGRLRYFLSTCLWVGLLWIRTYFSHTVFGCIFGCSKCSDCYCLSERSSWK